MKLLFIFLLSFQFAVSQPDVQINVVHQPIAADFFAGYDAFGACYYVKNNVFYKNDVGQIFEYKNMALGKPTKVDILNPLKIVLFYEGYNTVVTLDNQLNETQVINFSELEVPINVAAAGIAASNSLWVFNMFDNKIGLFDYNTNTYKNKSIAIDGNLKAYCSDFNYFYFIDNQNRLFRCDIYGRLQLLSSDIRSKNFKVVSDNKIIFEADSQLYLLDYAKNEKRLINISEKTLNSFSYKNEILSIFTNQQISNYNIKL